MLQEKTMPIILVLIFLGAAVWFASSRGNADESPQGGGQDVEKAWQILVESAKTKLQTSGQKEFVSREVMKDLTSFAEKYPGTEQASSALLNQSSLAQSLGDFETAKRSLIAARKHSPGPKLTGAINSQLAKLTIRPGESPPEFSATSLDGNAISLANYEGKVLLLDFWATWCGPCIAELPNVQAIYDAYHDEGLEIVSISLDRDEGSIRSFLKKRKMPWTHIYNDSLPEGKDIATRYGVDSIPHMLLVGRDGKIAEIGMRGPDLGKAVESALSAEKKSPQSGAQTPLVRAALSRPAPSLIVDEWVRGNPASLDDMKGKVVLLDFFQIICPGCHKAHPEIVRMQKKYGEKGLEVLGLAVAFELQHLQTPDHIRRYVDKQAYPYPVAIDKNMIQSFQRYGARGTPYTVLIDRQGRVRYLDFFDLSQVESTIQQLLEENVPNRDAL